MRAGARAIGAAVIVGALALVACEASDLVAIEARAILTPGVIELGEVARGSERSASVLIENPGTSALIIESFAAPDGSGVAIEVDRSPLAARETRSALVRFAPAAAGPLEVAAPLISNAENGTQQLFLRGAGVEPGIAVAPLAHDFGALAYGAAERVVVTIDNPRPVDHPVQIALVDDGDGTFALTHAQQLAQVVVPGHGRIEAELWYRPLAGGAHAGRVWIEFCGASCGVEVALTGRCAAPHLTADPISIDFGALGIGEQTSAQVTLRNDGLLPLQLTGISLEPVGGPFALEPAALPRQLAPGAAAVLGVRFAPLGGGEYRGRIGISSNDPAQPTGGIALLGITHGPHLVAMPEAIEFGLVRGSATLERTVMLSNRGDAEARVLDLGLAGSPEFALVAPPLSPFAVAPGSTVFWTVQYAPLDEGADFGQLRIASDSGALAVALAGSRADQGCQLTAEVTEVRFGHTRLGTAKDHALELENVGSEPCQLSTVEFSPAFVNDPQIGVGTASASLVPSGTTVTIGVRFAPTRDGLAKAVLAIRTADQPRSAIQIGISGVGAEWSLVAVPETLDFGMAKIGCAAVHRVVAVINDGCEPVVIGGARIDAASVAGYQVVGGSWPFDLQPGGSLLIEVAFAATQLGFAAGLLSVEDVDGGRLLSVPLQATGDSSVLQTDRFSLPPVSTVDVLFIVDNSGSMEDNQANLAQNFSHFISYADFRNGAVDYQIAVTTVDVPWGTGGLFVNPPRIMTRTTPDLEQQFASAVRVGSGGSGTELGLDAMVNALSAPLIDDLGANGGFLRASAALAVIVVSDEEDQSMQTIDFYSVFLRGLKGCGDQAPATFHAVTCGLDCPCDDNWGALVTRYELVVEQTGGQFLSICNQDWGANLELLGSAVFLARGRLRLTAAADPATIQVVVDGTALDPALWRYDAASQSVIIDPAAVPGPGAVVEVSYGATC